MCNRRRTTSGAAALIFDVFTWGDPQRASVSGAVSWLKLEEH